MGDGIVLLCMEHKNGVGIPKAYWRRMVDKVRMDQRSSMMKQDIPCT